MGGVNPWNPEGSPLRNVQLEMLEMMKYLDDICRSHDIQYMLNGGSALGAVRHKGFIPWDDDMDIALLEPDYKRLVKVLISLDSDKYVLHCQQTDFNYVNAFPKFRKREGNFMGSFPNRGRLYKWRGPGIDIFCFQHSSYYAAYLASAIRGRLVNWTWRIRQANIRRLTTKLMFALYACVKPFIIVLNIFSRKGELHNAMGMGWPQHYIWEQHLKPFVLTDFEDTQFPVPNNYDAFLTGLYGDWRTPPTAEEIKKTGTHSKELTNI